MKKRVSLIVLVLTMCISQRGSSQCIGDVAYLIESPIPCFFIGSVDASKMECFDPFTFFLWKYTWTIRDAGNGKIIASYDGMVFQHTFTKFGGYEFTLEIDKDGNNLTPAEIRETVTYTTCQPCGDSGIEIEYLSCPFGAGCNVRATAWMEAENTVGLLPNTKLVATYFPTSYELNGGSGEYDIELKNLQSNFNPETGLITVVQEFVIPYERGCFKPRIEFELEHGAGAHDQWNGVACQYVELVGEKTFRCIACTFEDGDCIASIKANEQEDCDVFSCVNLRNDEPETDASEGFSTVQHFQVGPNPASNALHVRMPADGSDRDVSLFDALGKRAGYWRPDGHLEITLTTLPPGVYHLMIAESGRVVFSEKIIVIK